MDHATRRHDPTVPAPTPLSVPASEPAEGEVGLSIDCASCVMQHTAACGDCVVTFICSRTPDDAVVVEVDEWRAVTMLQQAGLVPQLRHRRRTG